MSPLSVGRGASLTITELSRAGELGPQETKFATQECRVAIPARRAALLPHERSIYNRYVLVALQLLDNSRRPYFLDSGVPR